MDQVSRAHTFYYNTKRKVQKNVRERIKKEMPDKSDKRDARHRKLRDLGIATGNDLENLGEDYLDRISTLKKSYNPTDVENIKRFSQSKELYEKRLELVHETMKEINMSMTETMKSMSDVTEKFINAVQEI